MGPELVDALLAQPAWLTYKAKAYFHKTDAPQKGLLDLSALRKVIAVLYYTLGHGAYSEKELANMVECIKPFHKQKNPCDPVLLDEDGFIEFFRMVLRGARRN